MSINHAQTPIEDLFENERRGGEILISQLRLIILVFFVPTLYVLRFFTGYIRTEYIFLSIVKWIVMLSVAALVYAVLRRGFYRRIIGYFTLTLDLAFITISIVTLSFYKSTPADAMNDPLFILYYLVGFSSGLRFDYRYTVYSIITATAVMASLVTFDAHYYAIAPDYTLLIDRITAFILFTLLSIAFARRFREFIIQGYNLMERHLKVIEAILDIGRKISSHSELKRTLKNITFKAREILQSDLCWVLILDGQSPPRVDIMVSENDLPATFSSPDLCRITGKGGPLILNPHDHQLKCEGHPVQALIATPIKIENGIIGALFVARLKDIPYGEYDRNLLDIFAEQTAICIKNSRLLDRLQQEGVYFQKQLDELSSFEDIIGASPRMREVFAVIKKAATADIPVLIRGESGTGKELVARALHNLSRRQPGPFITINCAAIPSELLESELFGYEKGAFTGATRQKKGRFELAGGGTIFLDEIGDMNSSLQGKLLRVLQEQTFERVGGTAPLKTDVRIITATHQNLEDLIRKGLFREDLFYRINTLPILLPTLRERPTDIPLLVRHFLQKHAPERQIEFTRSAMDFLMHKEWKGNVRELENLIQRLTVLLDKDLVSEKDLHAIDTQDTPIPDRTSLLKEYIVSITQNSCNFPQEIEHIEQAFIAEALRRSGGSVRKAAGILGLPKSTLFNKLNKYEMKQTATD